MEAVAEIISNLIYDVDIFSNLEANKTSSIWFEVEITATVPIDINTTISITEEVTNNE